MGLGESEPRPFVLNAANVPFLGLSSAPTAASNCITLEFFCRSAAQRSASPRHNRGPKAHPKSRNIKKKPRLREIFRKVRANFCLRPCYTSQESKGNCSDELVQMNFFILGGFFWVDFPPLTQQKLQGQSCSKVAHLLISLQAYHLYWNYYGNHLFPIFGPAPLQKCVGEFCVV